MKAVAVLFVACIAVALAYPYAYDDKNMEIRPGNPVVYNQAAGKWEQQFSQIQEKCDEGGYLINYLIVALLLFFSYIKQLTN